MGIYFCKLKTNYISMSKKWAEHNEEAGHPAGLKAPETTGEYVNVLMANVSQESVKGPTISGSFSPDKKDVADEISGKLKKALENVSDSKVDVVAKFDVGATF